MPLETLIVDETSNIPKYKQIVNLIKDAINDKKLKVGDKIPSVNEVSQNTGFAKKTIVQAFERLKELGIITSVQYKGYYVSSSDTQTQHNIFVLFNKLTAYKEDIYTSIKSRLGKKGLVDIFFHHENLDVFETLLEKNIGKYSHYIIMPIDHPKTVQALRKLPRDKVYILDLGFQELQNIYPSVCQDFEADIYEAMRKGIDRIKKYDKVILVCGPKACNVRYAKKGFVNFCKAHDLSYEVIASSKRRTPKKGELYITGVDRDLALLVKKASALSLQLGKDMGIISYNEIPYKEIVANGIATISTDFSKMGRDVIDLILHRKAEHRKNPCNLILRDSF